MFLAMTRKHACRFSQSYMLQPSVLMKSKPLTRTLSYNTDIKELYRSLYTTVFYANPEIE